MTTHHPLQHRWTLFTDKYFQNMRRICSFDSIEMFWRCYNNIPQPSQLAHLQNYRMFHQGVEPKAEDPANLSGGAWIATIPDAADVDKAVLYVVLAAIGHTLDDNVVGVVVNARRTASRVCVWTRYGGLDEQQRQLGSSLRQMLSTLAGSIVFKLHTDTVKQKNVAFMASAALSV